MLNQEITRQASTIAYIDDFKLMLILALCSMPLVLLIRRTNRGGWQSPRRGDGVTWPPDD